jgi:hypothetical protein
MRGGRAQPPLRPTAWGGGAQCTHAYGLFAQRLSTWISGSINKVQADTSHLAARAEGWQQVTGAAAAAL